MNCCNTFPKWFVLFSTWQRTVYIWTGKEMKSWVHSLLHTIYIINLIVFHQELSHLFVILSTSKKKPNNSAVPTTHRGLRHSRNSIYNTMRRPPPHHYQAKKVTLLTYFSLHSAVPSGRRSREHSEERGRGGSDGCWAGPREGMSPTAPGALNIPLPIPRAALPNGNTDVSEFPLPSILKC